MAEQQPGLWVRGAVWSLGLGLGIVIGLISVLYTNLRTDADKQYSQLTARLLEYSSRKRALTAQVSKLGREVSSVHEHVTEHDRSAQEWKDRIASNEKRLHILSSSSTARPDPFTGTQGRVLERRLDQVSFAVKQIEKRLHDTQKLHQ